MTSGHDDLDMSTGRDLDDRLVEDLLRGRPTPRALEQRHLAAAIAALQDVSAVDAQPGPELQQLFAEGLRTLPAPVEPEPAPRRAAAWPSLGLRPLAARVAGLSLAFKLLLGGTAVAATALGGAGAAGVLPGQADRDPGAIHPEVEPEAPTEDDDPTEPADTGTDDAPAGGTTPEPPPPTTPDPLVPRGSDAGDGDVGDRDGDRLPDGQTDGPELPRDGAPTTPPAPDPGEPPVTDPTDRPAPAPTPPPAPAPPDPPEDPVGGPGAGSGAPGTPPPPPEDAAGDDPADPPQPPTRGDAGAATAAGTPPIP